MQKKKVKVSSINVLSPLLEELLAAGAPIKLTVTGNSMYPLLRSGVDEVLLKKKDKLSKHDILFYRRENGSFVLHRIVKIKNDVLFLAGDFETVTEYPVYKEQALAVAEGIYRKGNFLSCRNLLYRFYSFFWVLALPYRLNIIIALKWAQQMLKGKGSEE